MQRVVCHIFLLTSTLGVYFSFMPLYTMEVEKAQDKPLIQGKIYRNNQKRGFLAGYVHSQHLNNIGLRSSIAMPLVPVFVDVVIEYGPNQNHEIIDTWTEHIPLTIKNFENNDADSELKKFPEYIPAIYFEDKQIGDIIELTIHGYPV